MDPLIKELTQALGHHLKNQADTDVLRTVVAKIDAVIDGTSDELKAFSTTDFLTSECLSGIVKLLNSPRTPPELSYKSLQLLANLVTRDDIREMLKQVYNLPAALAFLIHMYAGKPNSQVLVLQCLCLLQEVTYNYQVTYPSTHMEELVHFLITNVSQPENDLTLPSLGLLANLCRANTAVQIQIRSYPNVRAINKTLMKLLSSSSLMIIVCALSILTSLCFNDDLGEKLFQGRNITQTFQLIFNLLLHKEGTLTCQYTVDLFIDLMKHDRIQRDFVRFRHLEESMRLTVGLLNKGQTKDLCKVVEFFLAAFKIPDLRPMLLKIFVKNGEEKTSSVTPLTQLVSLSKEPLQRGRTLPVLTLRLISEVYEEWMDSNCPYEVDNNRLIDLLAHNLTTPAAGNEESIQLMQCHRIINTVQLVHRICEDGELKNSIVSALDTQGLRDIIRNQLEVNEIISLQTKTQVTSECSEAGVEMTLCLLELMDKLSTAKPSLGEVTQAIFKDKRLVPFLVHGIGSQSEDVVQISLHLFTLAASNPEFCSQVLEERLAAVNRHRMKTRTGEGDGNKSIVNERGTTEGNRSLKLEERNSFSGEKGELDSKVDDLIKKMKNGLDLSALPASGIMDVYEHKLASLQTKHSHLEDLLETKAMALSQADHLISQHRCQWAEADAEARKLRSLLHESEKKKEIYREELQEASVRQHELGDQLERKGTEIKELQKVVVQYDKLVTTHAELTQRLKETEGNLNSVTQELTSKQEICVMLKRHLETLKSQYEEATTNFEEQIRRKEKKANEQDLELQAAVEKTKQLAKDKDGLERINEQLEKKQEKSQENIEDLKQQLKEVQDKYKQLETAGKEKDEVIKHQKKELSKVQEMRRRIHNMTKH
ncbi:protein CIP2A-like isoform X2 [Apostichopus japonicus]|uniref:protein CIP2A-like isoform X2 n=1 Tax=Stichopus japonicus TaxID=307972 RepID=UPI003AB8ACD9